MNWQGFDYRRTLTIHHVERGMVSVFRAEPSFDMESRGVLILSYCNMATVEQQAANPLGWSSPKSRLDVGDVSSKIFFAGREQNNHSRQPTSVGARCCERKVQIRQYILVDQNAPVGERRGMPSLVMKSEVCRSISTNFY